MNLEGKTHTTHKKVYNWAIKDNAWISHSYLFNGNKEWQSFNAKDEV